MKTATGLLRRHFPLFLLILIFPIPGSEAHSAEVAGNWSQPQRYRLPITLDEDVAVSPGDLMGGSCDLGRALQGIDDAPVLAGSLRVVAVTPRGEQILPHAVSGPMLETATGSLFWRAPTENARQYFVYFDTEPRDPSWLRAARSTGLIGVGDTLHYRHGEPGPISTLPLHSQLHLIDWDGDGVRDLVGWAYRHWDFGTEMGKDMSNGVFFLKNLGTNAEPLFAVRQRLQDTNGKFLVSDLLPQNMNPVDWDGDGDTDFLGMGRAYELWLWENSGQRDECGRLLLEPGRVLMKLDAESEFRRRTPGILRKRNAWYPRGVRATDWEGDGDLDLLVAYRKVSRLREVDSSQGVMPYGTAVMVFDLYENQGGQSPPIPEQFAEPRTIREQTGFPLRVRGHANGGPEYTDWDGDGDFDLLFHDETARPLEGGRMMFAENRGDRSAPLFEAPIPILALTDSPYIVDFNEDGLTDVTAGGELFVNSNPQSQQPTAPRTPAGTRIPRIESFPRLQSLGLMRQVHPEILSYFTVAVDWEHDGDLDLVGGYHDGLRLFRNRGSTQAPVFDRPEWLSAGGQRISMPNWLDPQAAQPSTYGPQGPTEAKYGWLCPTLCDWDGDGDLDLFATGQRWETQYFENVGTRDAPQLAAGRVVRCGGRKDEFSWRSKVGAGDLDGDGQMELVVTADEDNTFYVYERVTSQVPGALEVRRATALKLESGQPVQGWYGGQNNNGDNHSLLVDWDGDGDLDLFNGSLWNIWYYENRGTIREPRFRPGRQFEVAGKPLHTFRHAGSFDVADWNGDGRLDLLLGTECPSDQPHGSPLHLFDRAVLEGEPIPVQFGTVQRSR